MEHPLLHDPETLTIEAQPLFGRIDYSPCNDFAYTWLKAWSKKSFNRDEIKFIQDIGYCVLVCETIDGVTQYRRFE